MAGLPRRRHQYHQRLKLAPWWLWRCLVQMDCLVLRLLLRPCTSSSLAEVRIYGETREGSKNVSYECQVIKVNCQSYENRNRSEITIELAFRSIEPGIWYCPQEWYGNGEVEGLREILPKDKRRSPIGIAPGSLVEVRPHTLYLRSSSQKHLTFSSPLYYILQPTDNKISLPNIASFNRCIEYVSREQASRTGF